MVNWDPLQGPVWKKEHEFAPPPRPVPTASRAPLLAASVGSPISLSFEGVSAAVACGQGEGGAQSHPTPPAAPPVQHTGGSRAGTAGSGSQTGSTSPATHDLGSIGLGFSSKRISPAAHEGVSQR